MEIFLATTGFSSIDFRMFMQWFLVSSSMVFFILVIIGAYKRWSSESEDLTESLVEVLLGAILVGAIFFYIGI